MTFWLRGLLSIAIFGCFSTAKGADSSDRLRIFAQALETFDRAKTPDEYRQAAHLLESLLTDGFQSGVVYYNLGNAYYRAGEFGRAILHYRKAKLYRPRDPYLESNLQQALAMAHGRLAESPKAWWIHVLFWNEWISFSTKILLVTIGLAGASVLVFIGFYFRITTTYWISSIAVLAFGAVGIDAALSSPELLGVKRAVIVGETIARKGTGSDFEPSFTKPLEDGAEFTVLNETDGWTFGHFQGVGDGWVRNEFIAR